MVKIYKRKEKQLIYRKIAFFSGFPLVYNLLGLYLLTKMVEK